MSDDLEAKLERAAARALDVKKVKFEGFFPVVETSHGEIIWEGVVNLYDSDNGRAFAWAVEGDQEPQYVAILQKSPVFTPLDAVRTWIVLEARKNRR